MTKINNNLLFTTSLLLVFLFSLNSCKKRDGEENYIKFKKLKDVHQYFAYESGSSILVSAHRGGREPGYPENSMEGFQHVLPKCPPFLK